MSGMKEGTGDDPFADDDDDLETDVDTEVIREEPRSASSKRRDRDSTTENSEMTDSAAHRESAMALPYIYRRDSVQEERERVPLFLMEDTKGTERDLKANLEKEFDDTVSLTDVREAAYLVGMTHMSEVVEQLEEWGYGFDD